jgi:hypothetical protein
MLVYAKNPNGMLMLGGRRIYGAEMVQGPTDVPFELYDQCREALIEATYREGHLQKIFGKPFPEVAFTYHEVRFIPDKTLDKLLVCMGRTLEADWTRKHKIEIIKYELRNAETT